MANECVISRRFALCNATKPEEYEGHCSVSLLDWDSWHSPLEHSLPLSE